MTEYRRLDDICNINMGQSPASDSYNEDGDGLPFFQGNADFGELYPEVRIWCNAPTKIVEPETLLISVRAPIGALNFSRERSCIGRGLAGITPMPGIELKYVYYCLKGKNAELNAKGTGSTFKAIAKAALGETSVRMISLVEQQEIIQTIDKLSEVIRQRKQQLADLDTLIKARFVEMFGSIHDSDKFPYIPVKKLTNVVSGGTPSRDVSEYWDNGDIPWVKTTELQNSVIESVDEYITEKGKNNSAAKIVPVGTVLVAMYGQGKTRGMTGYLGIEATTNQACACILPSNHINMMYLWKYFELSYDKLRSLAQGGGQPNLNVNIIKSFHVLVPPREMQDSFVLFVHQVNKSKAVVQKALDEAQTLFDSLMQQYFG